MSHNEHPIDCDTHGQTGKEGRREGLIPTHPTKIAHPSPTKIPPPPIQPPTVVCKNGNSVGICTRCTHFFARLAPIRMLSRRLLTKFLHRSSGGSFLRVLCWLGSPGKTSPSLWWMLARVCPLPMCVACGISGRGWPQRGAAGALGGKKKLLLLLFK